MPIPARVLGKAKLAALWLKTHSAAEESMARDLRGYFQDLASEVTEKVADKIEARLDDLADDEEEISPEKAGELAEELADDLIDVDEIYQEVLGLVREHIEHQVQAGAALELRVSVPTRTVDWAWLKAPGLLPPDSADTSGSVAAGARLELPEAILARVEEYTREILEQPYWRGVAETIRDDIAGDIRRGIVEGLSGKEVAKSIKESLGGEGADARATLIARSEATGALNAGHQTTRDELAAEGLIEGKEWLAILDEDTRESHVEVNGQKVPNDEPFNVGGEEAQYPGDVDLSPAERCNCRCVAVSVFGDEEQAEEKWQRVLTKWAGQ